MQVPLPLGYDVRCLLISVYQKTEYIPRKKEREKGKKHGTGEHHNLFEAVDLPHPGDILRAVKLRHKHTAGFGKRPDCYQKEKGKLIGDIDRAHFDVAQPADHKVINQRNEALHKGLNHYRYGKPERLPIKVNRPQRKSF